MKFREKLWLWGQNPGGHHAYAPFNLPGENKIESHECCREWKIPNCCRVRLGTGPKPPFDAESKKLEGLKKVVWSVVGASGVGEHNGNSDLDEVLRQAELFENITGGIMDDFFTPPGTPPRQTTESVARIAAKLHSFPKRKLDLWIVWYERELEYDVDTCIQLCDVITFWTWWGKNLDSLARNLDTVRARFPDKRLYGGIYMWDYPLGAPLSIPQMEHQCAIYYDRIRSGELEGAIICSNCVADIGLKSAAWLKSWVEKVGDTEI